MENKKKIMIMLCLGFILITAIVYLNDNEKSEKAGLKNSKETIIKCIILGERYKDSDSIFSKFNKELKKYFPDTTVEFEVVPKESFKEKWDMKIATNEKLDLAWIGNDILNYTEEVKKGSFTALDYLIETYGGELKKVIPEKMWKLQKNEGNTYSIPIPGILYRKSCGVVASKELMDKYGDVKKIGLVNRSKLYTDKECFDSLEEFLHRAKADGAIGGGVSYKTISQIADKGYEGIYGSDSPFVIKIFDKELMVYNKYETEPWKLCFKTMADWYKKGYIREDIADVLNPLNYDGKMNGSIIFFDDYGELSRSTNMIKTEYEAVIEPLEGYKYISYGACRNSIVIPKSTEHPQRAMEIVNFLMSDKAIELNRLLADGIKNNNYEISQSELKKINQYNENALISPLSGFELDTRMIILEMSKVDLVVDEYKERLIQGTAEDWQKVYEEFIAKMKKAGSDKAIQEIQKQIDKFRKLDDKKI